MSEEREKFVKNEVEGHMARRRTAVDEDAQPTAENDDPQAIGAVGDDDGPDVEGHKILKS